MLSNLSDVGAKLPIGMSNFFGRCGVSIDRSLVAIYGDMSRLDVVFVLVLCLQNLNMNFININS